MLPEEEFRRKYDTTFTQKHPESFLDEVSKEDRELYEDVEILTGKSLDNKFNKFNNSGKKNKGKTYNTVRQRARNAFSRFLDEKITSGEMKQIFEQLLKEGKLGSYKHIQLLLDRSLGKEEEKMNVKVDSVDFVMDESKLIRKKKNEKE